ncbi:hypothetical protein D9758_017141 [Tetrapyrgos nigripes]|uniref:DNA-directed RNA polymerase subunit n=1 Tax=Tetrapyrgos nigripes TaxID=182062 RepID=A0A8H5BK62_9AGAR|nr:hypothetical protein D9758_017141 [Tetrapyrgos nigripes]
MTSSSPYVATFSSPNQLDSVRTQSELLKAVDPLKVIDVALEIQMDDLTTKEWEALSNEVPFFNLLHCPHLTYCSCNRLCNPSSKKLSLAAKIPRPKTFMKLVNFTLQAQGHSTRSGGWTTSLGVKRVVLGESGKRVIVEPPPTPPPSVTLPTYQTISIALPQPIKLVAATPLQEQMQTLKAKSLHLDAESSSTGSSAISTPELHPTLSPGVLLGLPSGSGSTIHFLGSVIIADVGSFFLAAIRFKFWVTGTSTGTTRRAPCSFFTSSIHFSSRTFTTSALITVIILFVEHTYLIFNSTFIFIFFNVIFVFMALISTSSASKLKSYTYLSILLRSREKKEKGKEKESVGMNVNMDEKQENDEERDGDDKMDVDGEGPGEGESRDDPEEEKKKDAAEKEKEKQEEEEEWKTKEKANGMRTQGKGKGKEVLLRYEGEVLCNGEWVWVPEKALGSESGFESGPFSASLANGTAPMVSTSTANEDISSPVGDDEEKGYWVIEQKPVLQDPRKPNMLGAGSKNLRTTFYETKYDWMVLRVWKRNTDRIRNNDEIKAVAELEAEAGVEREEVGTTIETGIEEEVGEHRDQSRDSDRYRRTWSPHDEAEIEGGGRMEDMLPSTCNVVWLGVHAAFIVPPPWSGPIVTKSWEKSEDEVVAELMKNGMDHLKVEGEVEDNYRTMLGKMRSPKGLYVTFTASDTARRAERWVTSLKLQLAFRPVTAIVKQAPKTKTTWIYAQHLSLVYDICHTFTKGPISAELSEFPMMGDAPVHYKIGMSAYMFSYYGVASACAGFIINASVLHPNSSDTTSTLSLLACVVVFPAIGNLGFILLSPDPDTLQHHLDTRFAQLNTNVELELWQEASRSFNLLTMAKAPRPVMIANYSEKLTKIFLMSGNALYHAAAWGKYYAVVTIIGEKSDEELSKLAGQVLISALAIPVGLQNDEEEAKGRATCLTSLLGLTKMHTRTGLLKDVLSRNVLKISPLHVKQLYNIHEVTFGPLTLSSSIAPLLKTLSSSSDPYAPYLSSPPSSPLPFIMLLRDAGEPGAYNETQVEAYVMGCALSQRIDSRVDHLEGCIVFILMSHSGISAEDFGVGAAAGTSLSPAAVGGASGNGVGSKENAQKHCSIYTTFKKMSDSDLHLIGLSEDYARPEWMILTVMPVPPPPVRPSIPVDGGAMRSEDDLTYKLGDIIKSSANVRRCEQEGAPAHVIAEFEQLLQFHVATYMDNDIAGIPQALQKSGHPVKAIRARLKGKEGRLHGNLMGKRVDFSAHTVITGDPNLALDKVGVPRSIAMNLTFLERVTPYNITYLQELVRNGPMTYPGARYVVRDTGERIDLRYNKRADAFLQYGWVVERHLKDGDLPLKSFRYSPYNADFDGDEMNMHVPQSEETWAELSQIAWVPRQIISPQANKPVMGIVQDTLCGIRKFTLRDSFLDWQLWVPEWDGVVPIPAILKPKPLWTGKQILSMVIPPGINIHKNPKPKSSNPVDDGGMLIENGEILFGIVRKGHSPEATCDLFTGIQYVVNYWLFHNGFSIGIGDTIADSKTMAVITQTIADRKADVAKIIEDACQDCLKAAPGMTIRESFESMVERQLNLARHKSGQFAQKNLKDDNNVKQMVVAGSKGCCIPFGFHHRTLPHFTKDDFSPEAHGFVENSYLHGLTLQEFFFHAMAGREGLIDTAVKTAETGYIQRRLVKALEDVMVCYDGTVWNSLGDLIQFVYGEDGMDGAHVEKQLTDTFSLSDWEFEHVFRVDVTDPEGGFLLDTRLQLGIDTNSAELQTKLDEEYAQLRDDRRMLREFIFPPQIPRPTNIFLSTFPRKPTDLEPAYIIDAVQDLCRRLIVVRGDNPLTREAQENATLQFCMHLRAAFAARKVIEQYHLTREAFDWVLGEVESNFNQSLAHPDEMCGTLAAQSIGEPATQMTLNPFHYAGV